MDVEISLYRIITELTVTDKDTKETYLYKEVRQPDMKELYCEIMDKKQRLVKPVSFRYEIFKAVQEAMGRNQADPPPPQVGLDTPDSAAAPAVEEEPII